MKTTFIRTCQECGTKHESDSGPMPGTKVTNAYLFKKCRKCKSESLDYGSFQMIAETPEEQKQIDEEY